DHLSNEPRACGPASAGGARSAVEGFDDGSTAREEGFMELRPASAGSRDPIEQRAGWKGFLAAVVAVAAATGMRWALDSYLGDDIAFVTYFLAIVVAAWYGRLWPGVLAT